MMIILMIRGYDDVGGVRMNQPGIVGRVAILAVLGREICGWVAGAGMGPVRC